jgi:hypothetical protein
LKDTSKPFFTRLGETPLYAATIDEADIGWCGYLLPEECQAPSALILPDSFDGGYQGSYLFCPNPPDFSTEARINEFIKKIRTYLAAVHGSSSIQFRGRAFAWVADPGADHYNSKNISSFFFEKTGLGAILLSTDFNDRITSRITFTARKDCLLELNGKSFLISSSDVSRLQLTTTPTTNQTEIDPQQATLPLTGPSRGCLMYNISFRWNIDFNLFYTGLTYFYTSSSDESVCTSLNYPLFDTRIPQYEDKKVRFSASLDPADSLNRCHPNRTYFAFIEKNEDGSPALLPTNFRTVYGHSVNLIPAAVDSAGPLNPNYPMLVFEGAIQSSPIKPNYYYLAPSGDFYLSVAAESTGTQNLLCGLSGTEFISFQPKTDRYTGDILRFHPRQPAFAPRFPIIDPENNNAPFSASSNTVLNGTLSTAWVSILKNIGATQEAQNYYYSQPQDTPLFKATENSGVRLEVFEAPSANLAHSAPEDCFPLVPAATAVRKLNLSNSKIEEVPLLQPVNQFEIQILNPTRKRTIQSYTEKNPPMIQQSPPSSPNPANLVLTTTPQGFLVAIDQTDASKKWYSLTLANNEDKALNPLELMDIPPYIQSAFQTNEQFLVVTNPEGETLRYLADKFHNQIDIAEWPFLLDVAGEITSSNTTSRYKNILIFKFCSHSLVDRLQKPALWTQPEIFNQSHELSFLSDWILKYINHTRQALENSQARQPTGAYQQERAVINQGYRDFLAKVENPNWNGIMALQVTLNLEELPEAIKSIVAGIDIRRFAAHHFGIDANQIKSKNGELDKDFKSSMFGLITYFDPDYEKIQPVGNSAPAILPEVPGDYEFKVLELQVLFKNSLIADFNCRIQLSINELFNEPVINESDPGHGAVNMNSIVLEGLYEKHNGHTSYTFRQLSDKRLDLKSIALQSVNVHSIGLSTVHQAPETVQEEGSTSEAETDTPDRKRVTTRFSLAGQVAMAQLEDFDMLSYDSIIFSALYIDMVFNIDSPRTGRQFIFTPTDMVLDPAESHPREKSLVAHFPITLESLVHYTPPRPAPDSTATPNPVTPQSLGYERVEAPLNYNPINTTWYALQFKLNLGTMGALTAKAGFDATLLLAWSPGTDNKAAQAWVKLPFSGGGKKFSIQGVLKIAIQSIFFEKAPNKPEYAMLFSNIKLSLLGKKLPPSGNTLLYLFGNPKEINTGGSSETGNLAWFGAYNADKDAKKEEIADHSKSE